MALCKGFTILGGEPNPKKTSSNPLGVIEVCIVDEYQYQHISYGLAAS